MTISPSALVNVSDFMPVEPGVYWTTCTLDVPLQLNDVGENAPPPLESANAPPPLESAIAAPPLESENVIVSVVAPDGVTVYAIELPTKPVFAPLTV
jgi:hypothetical protein